MRCLSLPQPWAAALVFGAVSLANLPRKTRCTGRVLIHAHEVNPCREQEAAGLRAFGERTHYCGPLPIVDLVDHFIGCANLIGCESTEVCQDPEAQGPWCWLFDRSVVLQTPVYHVAPGRTFVLDDARAGSVLSTWCLPREYRDPDAGRVCRSSGVDVLQRSADGWTGD